MFYDRKLISFMVIDKPKIFSSGDKVNVVHIQLLYKNRTYNENEL